MSGEEFFDKAMQAVLDGDEDGAVEIANRAIAEGINPVAMINEGLTPGMTQVGDLFAKEEYALPQVLLSADAMKKAIEVLEPHISKEEAADKLGVVVIGTVQGDIHDIGKNIVATMFRVYGFEVHDLGKDVSIDTFIEKAKELNADIIATSSLMTTTMVGQKVLEEGLNNAGLKDKMKTMVGGAAVTQEWASRIGADGYAEDVNDAVKRAKQLLS